MISDRTQLRNLRDIRRKRFRNRCPTYTIRTWVPEKYLLIDTETEDRWQFVLTPSGDISTTRAPDPHEQIVFVCSRCHRTWGMQRIDAEGAYQARAAENVCFECEPEGW